MTDDPTRELSAELRRRGLAVPARLLLEAHRPLRPLLDQAATFLTPTLVRMFGRRSDAVIAALAADEAYDRLLAQLEEQA
jgi:hypothetical protein